MSDTKKKKWMGIKTAVVVGIILLTGISGCKRTITGPKPPGEDNDIEYPFNVSNDEWNSYDPYIGVDSRGRIYIIWQDAIGLKMRMRDENKRWSEVDTIAKGVLGYGLAVDIYDNVHIVWLKTGSDSSGFAANRVFYRELYSSGAWSDIEELTDTPDADQPIIAADSMGGVHVMWLSNSQGWLYKYREPDGTWEWRDTLGQLIVNPTLYSKPDGSLTMLFSGHMIHYYEHPAGGRWSREEIVDTSGTDVFSWWGSAYYEADRGRTLVLWTEEVSWDSGAIMYRYRYDGGGWSEVHELSRQLNSTMPREKEVIERGGMKYLIWGDGFYRLYMAMTIGEFDSENVKVKVIEDPGAPYFDGVVDNMGVLHLVWSCEGPDSREDYDVYYKEIQLAR